MGWAWDAPAALPSRKSSEVPEVTWCPDQTYGRGLGHEPTGDVLALAQVSQAGDGDEPQEAKTRNGAGL